MFNINDNVIHKSAGACIVKNIIKQNFGNGDIDYYYLTPKFPSIANKSLEIYLPVPRFSSMRPFGTYIIVRAPFARLNSTRYPPVRSKR